MSEEVCVRVAVRIRPLLPKEILHSQQVCVRAVPDAAQVMLGADRTFPFDYAFGPAAPQAEVYESCVRPLLTSLLDGHNATVFAYGQTGSGKTYTLGGGHVAALPEDEGGIVSRVAQDLFSLLGEGSEAEAEVRVSYMELYMEELRDLLELDTTHKELHIREDDRGNTVVVGASETAVTSAEELLSVLAAGDALRHTGPTQMNERSSRSHAILTLQLAQRRRRGRHGNGPARCSKLHLVDLAGSERAGRTGNTGRRLKESVNINAGLLALGNVIRALTSSAAAATGGGHVPYRDAKITRLLRDSLGGSAHTLMVACVSPAHPSVAETLSVLQFASRARRVRNRPGARGAAGVGGAGAGGGAGPGWDPREARVEELEHEVRALRDALKGRGGADGEAKRGEEEEEEKEEEEGEEPRFRRRDVALLLEELQSLASAGGDARRRLQDWLERRGLPPDPAGPPAGRGSEGPRDVTVQQLRQDLRKCQEALAADEEAFGQKEVELREARREVERLLLERRTQLQDLQEEREHRRIQSDRLVEQQLQIDRLRGDLLASRATPSPAACAEPGASGTAVAAVRRPHSVPLLSQARHATRKIQTSPPACSLERVMAAFRTRSQLLLAQIEERDEVFCPGSAQEEGRGEEEEEEGEEEEGEEGEEGEEEEGTKKFRRSLNRTWTSKQNQSQELDSAQNHKNRVHLTDLTAEGEGSRARRRQRKAELRASNARRIQELSVNIRLKEELIKELDKTGKEAQAVDRLFAVDQRKTDAQTQGPGHGRGQGALALLSQRVQLSRVELQRSVEHLRLQTQDLQRQDLQTQDLQRQDLQTQDLQTQDLQTQDLQRQDLQRQDLQTQDLQRQDLHTQDLHTQDLHTQDLLTDQHNTDLTGSTEPWTEDLSVCQNGHSDDTKGLADRRAWLEREEELALQRRRGLQELEEELRRREEVLLQREACLEERNQLELKRLRSSQTLTQDLLRVSARLGAVEEELEGGARPSGGVSLAELQTERDGLRKRKDHLDGRLRDGRLLTVEEEHALLQLEEAVEALDAAVEFKNRSIQERRRLLGGPAHADLDHAHDDVMRKLRELSLPEASALLVKYFNKVVSLRERERGLRLRCQELRLHADDQGAALREAEAALRRLTLDTDRRLTQQHREHQSSVQLLLQQLQEAAGGGPGEADGAVQARLQQLERELFFYKSTSRELKRKLRDLAPDQPPTPPPSSSSSSSHARLPAPGRKAGGDRDGAAVAELTPVRLSRREVRQIAPADRPRKRADLAASWDSSFQEDSIEVPPN